MDFVFEAFYFLFIRLLTAAIYDCSCLVSGIYSIPSSRLRKGSGMWMNWGGRLYYSTRRIGVGLSTRHAQTWVRSEFECQCTIYIKLTEFNCVGTAVGTTSYVASFTALLDFTVFTWLSWSNHRNTAYCCISRVLKASKGVSAITTGSVRGPNAEMGWDRVRLGMRQY